MRELREMFRAKDARGNEYEIQTYVDVDESHHFGGGPARSVGFGSAVATLVGTRSTFDATWVEGDTYKLIGLGEFLVTRIR
jgi:hypothetical protein